MSGTVLVIDDNAEFRNLIRLSLENSGYTVFAASNGQESIHILRAKKVDTVLLDLVLPDGDGLSLMSEIRKHSDAPVIVISGKGSLVDRVVGLEMGADDYLGKPFQMEELNARVKAGIRRYKKQVATQENNRKEQHDKIRFDGFLLDAAQFQVFDPDGESCALTSSEFQMLHVLVRNANHVMTRVQILDAFRTDNLSINDRAIDIQVARIRKKLGDDPKDPKIIKTVRGVGYMLACNAEVVN